MPSSPALSTAGPAGGETHVGIRPPEATAPTGLPGRSLEPTEGSLTLLGRAVGEDGSPIPGPSVEVSGPSGLLALGRGEPDGTFTLRVPSLAGEDQLVGVLTVVSDDARLARKEVRIRDARSRGGAIDSDLRWRWPSDSISGGTKLGDLVLRSSRQVTVHVTTAEGRPVRARVVALPALGGSATPRASCLTEADSRGLLQNLTTDAHVLVAWAPGHGRARTELPAGTSAPPTTLVLPAERSLAVLVLMDPDGVPVPNARVDFYTPDLPGTSGGRRAEPYVPLAGGSVTGEEGRVTVDGLAANDSVWLVPSLEGLTLSGLHRGYLEVPPGEKEVTVRVARRRVVAWPVVSGELPVPADGSQVLIRMRVASDVSVGGLPTTGRMERGLLVVEDCPLDSLAITAVAPDRGFVAWARARAGTGIDQDPISFQRARRTQVSLRYPDGAPASGIQLAFSSERSEPVGLVTTDEQGTAELLTEPPGRPHMVWLADGLSGDGDAVLWAQSQADGDTRIEATIERIRTLRVLLRSGGAPVDPATVRLEVDGVRYHVRSSDTARGEVEIAYRPRHPDLMIRFYAQGERHSPGWSTIPADDPPAAVSIDLRPENCKVIATTVAPPGQPHDTHFQRFDLKAHRWTVIDDQRYRGAHEPYALEAGTYRLVDATSGTVGEPFDLIPDVPERQVTLDLTKVVKVTGRIEVPAGSSVHRVPIQRIGGDSDVPSRSRRDSYEVDPAYPATSCWTDEQGRFELLVPGSTPVRLRVAGPWLVPAVEGGTVEVLRPSDPILLKCARAPRAWIWLDREVRRPSSGSMRDLRDRVVRLYRGEPVGVPAYETVGRVDDNRFTFAGFDPGEWTIWIDMLPFAPVLLRNAHLGTRETDLGDVALSAGSSITVKAVPAEGEALVLGAETHPVGDASQYARVATSSRVTGLSAGMLEVEVSAEPGMHFRPRTITVDGKSDYTIEVPVRKWPGAQRDVAGAGR